KEKHIAEEAANVFLQGMKKEFGQYLNGPSQPLIDRIRNQYIWEILLKLPRESKLITYCKHCINQQLIILGNNKRYRSVQIIPNIDPVY
ncbi:hypothetical protein ABTA35_19680, partial [Acinetobacter baumannii]